MTTSLNKSQQLFEAFCESNSIPIYPIKRSSIPGKKTPDYEVYISGYRVVVEVKQLDPNPEDQKFINSFLETGSTGTITLEPGHRVRKAIDEAMPQLKTWSCGSVPTMIVLYNNVPLSPPYLDPQHILTAMYGVEEVRIIPPKPSSHYPLRWFHKFAGKRKVAPTYNRTLSALSVISQIDNDTIVLDVYQNDYASHHLEPNWLRTPSIRYFRLGPVANMGGLRTWVEI